MKFYRPKEASRFGPQATLWKPAPRQWWNRQNTKFLVPPDPGILRKHSCQRIPQRLSEFFERNSPFHQLHVSQRAAIHHLHQERRDVIERPLWRVVPNHFTGYSQQFCWARTDDLRRPSSLQHTWALGNRVNSTSCAQLVKWRGTENPVRHCSPLPAGVPAVTDHSAGSRTTASNLAKRHE